MGNYSYLFATGNGAKRCKIVWSKCKPLKQWILKELQEKNKNMTLARFAKKLHDTKFISYLDNEYITDLIEINKHLELKDKKEYYTPRLYFDYEGWNDLYYIEFHPGTEKIFQGVYHYFEEELPKFPNDATEEDEELYEQQRKIVIDKIHQRAMSDNNGWKVIQLTLNNEEENGSVLSLMCMLQGISPHDEKCVLNYLNRLPPEKAYNLLNMKTSDLFK